MRSLGLTLLAAIPAAMVISLACGTSPAMTVGPGHLSGHIDVGGCGGAAPPSGGANCNYFPARGADVDLKPVSGSATLTTAADSSGNYAIEVPEGRYVLTARVKSWSPAGIQSPVALITGASSPKQIVIRSQENLTVNLVIAFSPG
jgi:hypothetical protein